ncbi:MAG: hypothetical protein D6728_05255 [Cyanobacteria bacterium J055]|nr:MAG: hypothetical protein D6728_05255 [Cyanobacteria bacterium J055]
MKAFRSPYWLRIQDLVGEGFGVKFGSLPKRLAKPAPTTPDRISFQKMKGMGNHPTLKTE